MLAKETVYSDGRFIRSQAVPFLQTDPVRDVHPTFQTVPYTDTGGTTAICAPVPDRRVDSNGAPASAHSSRRETLKIQQFLSATQ